MAIVAEDAWQAMVTCEDHIECLQLSRCGRYACLGSAAGEIVVVDIETGRVVAGLAAHKGATLCMCLTPDGRLVSGGEDSLVMLHSLDTFTEVGRLRVHAVAAVNCATGVWVSTVACDPSRALIAAASGQTIIVADADGGAFDGDGSAMTGTVHVLGPLSRAVDCLEFMADSTLCSCGYGGVTMWRAAEAGACPERVPRLAKTYHVGAEGCTLGYNGWLLSLASSPDGEWIASGCSDNTVRLWRTQTGHDFKCGGYSSKITSVCWDPSGKLCATSGSNQATVWDFSSGSPAGSTPIACVGQRTVVTALAYHPAGRLIATGAADGVIKVYDTAAYEKGDLREGAVSEQSSSIEHLAWAKSGVLVAACGLGKCTAFRVQQ